MTQHELILKHIAEHGYITSMKAYEIGITQLATRIKELKEKGYVFETVDIKYKDKNGKRKHYYEYHLIKRGS